MSHLMPPDLLPRSSIWVGCLEANTGRHAPTLARSDFRARSVRGGVRVPCAHSRRPRADDLGYRDQRQPFGRCRGYPIAAPARQGAALRSGQSRPVDQSPVRHRPLQGRAHRASRRDGARHRRRDPGHRAGLHRGRQCDREGEARGAADRQARSTLRERESASRCAEAERRLPPQGPAHHHSRGQNGRAGRGPRRPGVRRSRKARSTRSTASPSTAIAHSPRRSCATSSRRAPRAGSTSSSPPRSTTPSGSTSTRTSCGGTI